ncbi:hypothetical protein HLH33_13010 [Gluconacetobacter diazotrophicus]|uniref:Uncharacterized protein n=1 Tax=Gluconacetobacter diazotrophicus TaxID=33996 RepID=A0A7W4I6N5_GLUDI|nr:hypothetical protein [Gluconacetobacter diazotrophicus]MBB2157219.1 hypothetical protein [Gluconacetobacter diazotrophicus]
MPSGYPTDWRAIDPLLPDMMRHGMTDCEIARRFSLPQSTVRTHITKLGLSHLRQRRMGGRGLPAPAPGAADSYDVGIALRRAVQSRGSNAAILADQVRVVSSGMTGVPGGRMRLPPGWGGSLGHGR